MCVEAVNKIEKLGKLIFQRKTILEHISLAFSDKTPTYDKPIHLDAGEKMLADIPFIAEALRKEVIVRDDSQLRETSQPQKSRSPDRPQRLILDRNLFTPISNPAGYCAFIVALDAISTMVFSKADLKEACESALLTNSQLESLLLQVLLRRVTDVHKLCELANTLGIRGELNSRWCDMTEAYIIIVEHGLLFLTRSFVVDCY